MKTIFLFGNYCLRLAQDKRKYEASKTYRTVLRHLECFSGGRTLCFCDLTPAFLMDFRRYLADGGCSNNTRLLYFRYLQALHRKAANEGAASAPGDLYDIVLTAPDEPVKRSVSAMLLRQIRDAALPQSYAYLAFARDMFLLTFYLRGIPFVDLAHLRQTDIKDGVLRYRRRKTGKLLVVTLEPCALEIIRRWRNSLASSPYLFPIIKCPGSDDYEQQQYQSGLRLYNMHLKKLVLALGLEEGTCLTSYTPRHTWANLAHKDGVDIPFISEALSHSSEKVTRCYMSSFTPDTLAAINRQVIGIIDKQGEVKKKVDKKRRRSNLSGYSGYLIEPEL